eukprot:gi/632966411/ref/XP_007899401.1/ PREDICTED: thioredoxin domain-containing protein 3-like [Callorhinchus milii]
MAGKRREIQVQLPITDEEEWEAMLATKGVSVLDVYQGWCGPCKAIVSLFKRLKLDIGDELLHFYTVEASRLPLLKGFEGKCEPVFLFVMGGKIVDSVKGVNPPLLNKQILEMVEEERRFYEEGAQRKRIEIVELYDIGDEIENFMEGVISKQVEKLFTIVLIRPTALTAGKDNMIKERIKETGYLIVAEEVKILSLSDAKELYDFKKDQTHFSEFIEMMTSDPCDALLLSEGGETVEKFNKEDFYHEDIEIAKTDEEDSDIRELAYRLFAFFFPTVYESVKKTEKTLAILRPKLVEENKDAVLDEIQKAGFTIAFQKQLQLTEYQITKFYRLSNQHTEMPSGFIEYMASGPLLALALVRENAIQHWRNLMGNYDIEIAQEHNPTSLRARYVCPDIPFNQIHGSESSEIAMKELRYFFPVEHTLIAIKPDAVLEYKEEIIAKIQKSGFIISAMKSVELTPEMAAEFYKDQKGKAHFKELVNYMSRGTSLMMILTKENAVRDWRDLMGPADLELAKKSFPNSFRAQFGKSILQNGLHGSSSIQHARQHIRLIFGEAVLDQFGIIIDLSTTMSTTGFLHTSPSTQTVDSASSSTTIFMQEIESSEPTQMALIEESDVEVSEVAESSKVVPATIASDSQATDTSTKVPHPDSADLPVSVSEPGSQDVESLISEPVSQDIESTSEPVSQSIESPISEPVSQDVESSISEPVSQDMTVPIRGPDELASPDESSVDGSVPSESPAVDASILGPDSNILDESAPITSTDLESSDVVPPVSTPVSADVTAPVSPVSTDLTTASPESAAVTTASPESAAVTTASPESAAVTAAASPESAAVTAAASPESAEVTAPETTEVTAPETTEVTAPETAEVTEPETTEVTEPETTEVTAPETTEVTAPETAEMTEPETTEVTEPETTEVTAPETTEVAAPETTEVAAPETTEVTAPETADVTNPVNGADSVS